MFKLIERRVGKDLADVYAGEKQLDDVIISTDEDTEAAMVWRLDDEYTNIFPPSIVAEYEGGPLLAMPNPWVRISDNTEKDESSGSKDSEASKSPDSVRAFN